MKQRGDELPPYVCGCVSIRQHSRLEVGDALPPYVCGCVSIRQDSRLEVGDALRAAGISLLVEQIQGL